MVYEKVDWMEAGRMLCEGYNFSEIAERFGVSRQCVQQHYNGNTRVGRNKVQKCVYPMLEQWLTTNRESYMSLGRKLFPGSTNPSARVQRIMVGKEKYYSLDIIKKLSDITGMTFEEMFKTEDK